MKTVTYIGVISISTLESIIIDMVDFMVRYKNYYHNENRFINN
jgi:hypothetical protein